MPAPEAPLAAPVVPEPIAHKEPTPVKQENPITNASTLVNNTTLPTQSNVATPPQQPSVTVSPPVEAPKTRTIEQDNHNSSMKEEELKKANEKIKRLEQQLNELSRNNNGRKLASTVQPLDAVHQHLAALEKPRSVEGYPPQVVIAVAALVFIFTYLFF